MKERKMQFSCYSKEKILSYSCSFISSLPLKGKKEVLWIQQQLWASNVHTENGMLTLVANGTVTTWSVSRIRRPPLAVMLAMSTPLGQTTHRTNSSFIISLSFNLFDNDYIRWWCVVACCSQALFFNLFEFKGDLLAWTFEERYCQRNKSTIFVQHIKNSTVNILLRSGGERCEHKQSSSSSLFFWAGGGHHLFSCQDELMFTRNKKKKNKPECFSPRMRNDAAQTSVCRCGCAVLHDAAWPFNIWEWTAEAGCTKTWWWTPCRPHTVRLSPLGVISASSVVVCLFWSGFSALACLFITAFPNVLI